MGEQEDTNQKFLLVELWRPQCCSRGEAVSSGWDTCVRTYVCTHLCSVEHDDVVAWTYPCEIDIRTCVACHQV